MREQRRCAREHNHHIGPDGRISMAGISRWSEWEDCYWGAPDGSIHRAYIGVCECGQEVYASHVWMTVDRTAAYR